MQKKITLAHGNGGQLTHELISSIFLPAFNNQALQAGTDSAHIKLPNQEAVFTTDSHVVNPIFFPGGDIGKLAVCGTINDLAVMGATPLYLSCGLILEDGLAINDLQQIINSMAQTANNANVKIVTGDTKVVEKNNVDQIFINTSGIGVLKPNAPKGISTIQPGDQVLISGYIGDHGIAIFSAREQLLETQLQSDCAPITPLIDLAMEACNNIRIMRDPTRGGLATTLNEFTQDQNFGIQLFEKKVPIREEVKAHCELLGFDPLYLANEGKVVMVVPNEYSDQVLEKLHSHPLGKNAAIIGNVTADNSGKVYLKTLIGGDRILDMAVDDLLPRIC